MRTADRSFCHANNSRPANTPTPRNTHDRFNERHTQPIPNPNNKQYQPTIIHS